MAHCLGSTPVCGVLLIVSSPLLSVLACFLCRCILCLVWTTHAQFVVGFMSWLSDVTFWQRRWDYQLYIHTKGGWLQLDSWMSFSPTTRRYRHTLSRYRFLCGKRHQEEASFCAAVCDRLKDLHPPQRPPVSWEASGQALLWVAKGAFDALQTDTCLQSHKGFISSDAIRCQERVSPIT